MRALATSAGFGRSQAAREELLQLKLERYRRKDELPAEGSPHTPMHGEAGAPRPNLAIASRGTVYMKRYRRAPFGWLKVELPMPREVLEELGTFEMRPLPT